MAIPLNDIPGIDKETLDLLDAVGFHDAEALARAAPAALAEEIEKANSLLKITRKAPNQESIEGWIASCREKVAEKTGEKVPEPPSPDEPINYELMPHVSSMLEAAPLAIPLPSRLMVENELKISDIPAGILLNRYRGDLDVRVEKRFTDPPSSPPPPTDGGGDIDISKLRSTKDLQGEPAPKLTSAKSAHDLTRAPREETNKGRSPDSRWYIHGILHAKPLTIYAGAATTFLLLILLPLTLMAGLLLFLSVEFPEQFSWVSVQLLFVPCILVVVSLGYLLWALKGSCRVCNQKLFIHRQHMKNPKAHHVSGLGYIFPLCMQILMFKWFRCTHCGTAIRLKE